MVWLNIEADTNEYFPVSISQIKNWLNLLLTIPSLYYQSYF